eukprot:INCI7016.1.p1 GENE.INCI7016.1~~INCI7016.1.p1  ORF type:complete len:590 (-),score=83.32 INCI7016.1:914-2683(-)
MASRHSKNRKEGAASKLSPARAKTTTTKGKASSKTFKFGKAKSQKSRLPSTGRTSAAKLKLQAELVKGNARKSNVVRSSNKASKKTTPVKQKAVKRASVKKHAVGEALKVAQRSVVRKITKCADPWASIKSPFGGRMSPADEWKLLSPLLALTNEHLRGGIGESAYQRSVCSLTLASDRSLLTALKKSPSAFGDLSVQSASHCGGGGSSGERTLPSIHAATPVRTAPPNDQLRLKFQTNHGMGTSQSQQSEVQIHDSRDDSTEVPFAENEQSEGGAEIEASEGRRGNELAATRNMTITERAAVGAPGSGPLGETTSENASRLEIMHADLATFVFTDAMRRSLVELSLSGNLLECQGLDLPSMSESWLRNLDLSGNRIAKFPPFEKPMRLLRLDLSFNKGLRVLSKDLGNTVPHLRDLNLEGCSLFSLSCDTESPTDNALLPLRFLEKLNLASNYLPLLELAKVLVLRPIKHLSIRDNPGCVDDKLSFEQKLLCMLPKKLPGLKSIDGNDTKLVGGKLVAMGGGGGLGEGGQRGFGASAVFAEDTASCSCLEGNPCVVSYNCQNWANRFEVARRIRQQKGIADASSHSRP